MSTDLVRDLFHSLETTLHDRLKVIEELLVRSSEGRGAAGATAANSDWKKALDEVRSSLERFHIRVEMLETNLYPLADRVANDRILIKTQETLIEGLERRLAILESKAAEKPVEAAEAEVEEEAAVVAEAEVLEVETEVEEEEEEVEEEEETEELVLEAFTYARNGKEYCRDQNNNVYGLDDEGNPTDEPVGIWNPKTERITRISPNA